jgi:hypothetical protein
MFGLWWFAISLGALDFGAVVTAALLGYLAYFLFLGPFVPKRRLRPMVYTAASVGVPLLWALGHHNGSGWWWARLILHVAVIYLTIEVTRFFLRNRDSLKLYLSKASIGAPGSDSAPLYYVTRGALFASCMATAALLVFYALPQLIHIPRYYTIHTTRPNWTYHNLSGKRVVGVGIAVRAHRDFTGASVYQLVVVNYRKVPLDVGDLSFRLVGMNGARYAPYNSEDESQNSSKLNPGMQAIINVGFHTGESVVGNYLIVSGIVVPISH